MGGQAHHTLNTLGPDTGRIPASPQGPAEGQDRPSTIAALYVETDGCYYGLDGVDPWDITRDARLYAGPHPVVAHPPCERWGRYWGGAPTTWPRLIKGDDKGCFAAALAAVRRWGGVLEHPEGSAAWDHFGLLTPPHTGGWIRADALHGYDGWTCCVEQGHYGHRARKKTWLYAVGVDLPDLAWGKSAASAKFEDSYHSAEERRRAIKTGICQRLSKRQRAATPEPFRDLLISIARSAAQDSAARHAGESRTPCRPPATPVQLAAGARSSLRRPSFSQGV